MPETPGDIPYHRKKKEKVMRFPNDTQSQFSFHGHVLSESFLVL